MKKHTLGFVAGGLQRLLRSPWYRDKKAAIEAHIRSTYEAELSSATSYWQRMAVENKIAREIKQQLESLGSPYCLWNCH